MRIKLCEFFPNFNRSEKFKKNYSTYCYIFRGFQTYMYINIFINILDISQKYIYIFCKYLNDTRRIFLPQTNSTTNPQYILKYNLPKFLSFCSHVFGVIVCRFFVNIKHIFCDFFPNTYPPSDLFCNIFLFKKIIKITVYSTPD